jgi:hypothetical protein
MASVQPELEALSDLHGYVFKFGTNLWEALASDLKFFTASHSPSKIQWCLATEYRMHIDLEVCHMVLELHSRSTQIHTL